MLVLNDDQVMLQDAARGFVSEKAPVAALRKIRDEKIADGFDRGLWRDMAEMGWTGVLVPEDQGGLGFGFVGAGVICEEMGRTLTASPFLSTAMMAATALARAGSPVSTDTADRNSSATGSVASAPASRASRTLWWAST